MGLAFSNPYPNFDQNLQIMGVGISEILTIIALVIIVSVVFRYFMVLGKKNPPVGGAEAPRSEDRENPSKLKS